MFCLNARLKYCMRVFFVNKRHVKNKMCAYNIEVLKDDNAEEKMYFL